MTSLIRAERIAVAEIEQAFIEAGWSDGYGMTDNEIRKAPSPLFYRNSTPVTAADAKVIKNGSGHNLYAVYNIIKPEVKYASNTVHHLEVTVAITFYYDDPYLFDEESGYDVYLEELLSQLAHSLWVVSDDGDEPVTGTSDKAPYIHRKVLYATNTF